MSTKSISAVGFIGSGRITRLLLRALSAKQALPRKILVSDPDKAHLQLTKSIAPDRIECGSDNKSAAQADLIFLAVHPPVVETVLADIRGEINEESILVSFVPGVNRAKLSEKLNGFNRLVRMIPNAPSLIHRGYNPLVFSPEISGDDKTLLLSLFYHWGKVVEVGEKKLEAYAVLTGMGPTYFWFQWLELLRLGESFGMEKDELKPALANMLHGAVDTLFNNVFSPEEVLDLIPGYPLKPHEADINSRLSDTVKKLFEKLSVK